MASNLYEESSIADGMFCAQCHGGVPKIRRSRFCIDFCLHEAWLGQFLRPYARVSWLFYIKLLLCGWLPDF